MKTPSLLLALASLLLGGCANYVVMDPNPYALRATDTSTISIELFTGNLHPAVAQSTELTSGNPAAASFAAVPAKVAIPGGTGVGSAVLTANTVDQDTIVTITGSWIVSGWNPEGSTTVLVRPPLASSTAISGTYITVAPSVTPSWNFRYDINSVSASGAGADLTSCTLVFAKPVTLTVISAKNALIGPITLTAVPDPTGKTWVVGGAPSATFIGLVVNAFVGGAEPGGTVTITAPDNTGATHTTTATGPRP